MPNPLTAVIPAQNNAKISPQPADGSGQKADMSFQSVLDDQAPPEQSLSEPTEDLVSLLDTETVPDSDGEEAKDLQIVVEKGLPVETGSQTIKSHPLSRPDAAPAVAGIPHNLAETGDSIRSDEALAEPPKRNMGDRRAEVSPVFNDDLPEDSPNLPTFPKAESRSVPAFAIAAAPTPFSAKKEVLTSPISQEPHVESAANPKPTAAPTQVPNLMQMQLLVSENAAAHTDSTPLPEVEEGLIVKETGATASVRETATANLPATARSEVARAIAGQMAAAITARPQSGAVEIALNPEELGRVSMVLNGRDDGLHLTIAAERPETLDLMRRHLAVLEAEFKSLGFGDLSFDLGNSADKGQDPSDSGENSFSETVQSELTSATLQRPVNLGTSGRIDIRL
ncbi:flagellar hook-length control protein FliK [Ruegeria lacuscaerulensis]|uniref:flagellar hook-length control protein FliK n=1 Tax=Ruegeria lacuscaerulensis TaxID=55218 RepID=UPI00147DDF2E|nr:flagellar hook-length control protein FliK [Ruegeria lacuscaerulensis]